MLAVWLSARTRWCGRRSCADAYTVSLHFAGCHLEGIVCASMSAVVDCKDSASVQCFSGLSVLFFVRTGVLSFKILLRSILRARGAVVGRRISAFALWIGTRGLHLRN